MADSKISAVTAITGSSVDTAADVLAIVDTSASATKKILVDELRNAIGPIIGTPVATTSGTANGFTSLPSWVTKITLSGNGVSTNGTSQYIVQIGDSGGYETSSYTSDASVVGASSLTDSETTGFLLLGSDASASATYNFTIILTKANASTNKWNAAGMCSRVGVSTTFMTGTKSLSGTLDRVQLTTVGGVNTFDAGEMNVHYQ